MMSNYKRVVLFVLVMLVLTGCRGNAEVQSSAENNPGIEGSGEGLEGDVENDEERDWFRGGETPGELPPATQLVMGMILLENTDLMIDRDQAESLIPYWKLYLNLLESDATAAEELEAVINEIRDTLTADQLAYITDLDLTQEDLMALMSELGINAGLRSDGEGTGTEFSPPDGMEGTRPGNGQGRGQDSVEGMDPELMATMQARREELGGAGLGGVNRMQTPLIETLLELLEGKVE